ncbi:MAG TPA: hypothetical protein VIO95_02800, partial [Mycobacterium sp.]
ASVLGVVLLIIDALRERQRREAVPATKTPPAQAHELGGDEAADYPEEGDEAAASEDAGSEADAADSVSDDQNTR